MRIRFGNLSVQQFAGLVDADFTPDEIELLESHRCDLAQFTDESKFHIFDDPALVVVIGSAAFDATYEVFRAANERRPFTREVGFYPIAGVA